MADLLFTPKLTAGDPPDLSAEARLASMALHAAIAILVCGQAHTEGKSEIDAYAIAFASFAPHMLALANSSTSQVYEIVTTAQRLGLELIPELRGIGGKVVIQ